MAKKIKRVIYLDSKSAEGSLKSIRAEARKVQNALDAGLIPKKDRKAAIKHLQKLKQGIKDIRSEYNGTNTVISKLKKSVGSGLGPMLLGAMSFQAIIGGFRMILGNIKDFQKAVSGLSSITGASKKDLIFYSKEARRTGTELKMMARDVIDAYKIVGSAKPELLKNKEALASVTKEAIILSHASEMELVPSVEALTDVMNQFDLPANQARRTINAMAAGSKEGAAAIPLIKDAILEFGVSANTANVPLEESVALVETLAEKGLKGSQAGIQLRNVLSKLEQSTDKELRPSLVGASQALVNLNDRQLDATERAKMFGERNAQAALILTQNIDRFNDLTEAVTGTSTAYEQANINMNNLAGDLEEFNTTWGNLVLALENGDGWLAQITRGIVKIGIELGKVATAAADSEAAIIPWYERLILMTNFQGLLTIQAKEAAHAQKILAEETAINEKIQAGYNSTLNLSEEALKAYKLSLEEKLKTLDETSERYQIYQGILSEITMKEESAAKAEQQRQILAKQSAEEKAKNTISVITKIDAARIKAISDDEAREKAALQSKFSREKEKLERLKADEGKKAELLKQLESNLQQDLQSIEDKYAEKKADKENKALLAKLEHELNAEADGSIAKLEAYQKYLDAKMEMELANLDLTEQEKELIRQQYRELNTEAENEYNEEQENLRLERLQLAAQATIDIMNGFLGVRANQDQAEIQRIDKDSDTKIQILKDELKEKLKNENLTADQRAAIEAQYQGKIDAIQEAADKKKAAIKTEQWKRERNAAILTSLIQGALAVAEALPNIPLSIASGIAAAAQTAVIATQPVPEFFYGGYTGDKTYFDDPYGGVAGVVHPNEWVAPAWMTQDPATANIIGMLEGIRQNGYADGGSVTTTTNDTPEFVADTTEGTNLEAALIEIVATNRALISILSRPLKAVYDQDELLNIQEKLSEFETIKSNNSLS